MSTAVDDVAHRAREGELLCAMELSDVAIEREASFLSSSHANSHRNSEDCVCTESVLVHAVAVKFDHLVVHSSLIESIHTDDALALLGNLFVDVLHSLEGALAAICLATVTEFASFANASGSTARNLCDAFDARFENNNSFDSRIATGIQDLTSHNRLNSRVCHIFAFWFWVRV